MTVELSNTMDIVRKSLSGTTSRSERSKIGQFFTPALIARYMASLFQHARSEVRILDPGAGVGVLFATLIDTLAAKQYRPYKKINGESAMRQSLSAAGIEVSNLYAAFVWLTARMGGNKGHKISYNRMLQVG